MEDKSEESELSEKEKKEIAKWFLINSPAGEIQYVAKDVRSVLKDDQVYEMAVSEAFPIYNKAHMISLEMPNRSGDVLITTFSELSATEYLDPRTAQVASVDHVKQICVDVRPATDEELPSSYIEEFRGKRRQGKHFIGKRLLRLCTNKGALDAEVLKYVGETYPKGVSLVNCTVGKDMEEANFELVVVISAARYSPQNFWCSNGSWRSTWHVSFKGDLQVVEFKGKIQVVAHYFEEGNVQLDATHECKDSTIMQSAEDCASTISNMIRHHENEYMVSLEASYMNLPDTTFKDLRRKLPVTRTLFPWQNTLQFSLTRDITKELGIEK